MRNHFHNQLRALTVSMIEMGSMCEKAIENSTIFLRTNKNFNLEEITNLSMQIDQMEREIESKCIKLLLQQQPVAGDLRSISAALKMVTDMKRIGTQALNIAELVSRNTITSEEYQDLLNDMTNKTIEMVNNSVDAYVKKDIDIARKVIDYDDVVDECFNNIKNKLKHTIFTDEGETEMFIDVILVAKYLEKIADHGANIGKWVVFSITGEYIA